MPPKPIQLLLLFGLLFTSCSASISESDLRAQVVFTGSEAADGCGWLIQVSEDLIYKPEDLDEKFKVDGLEVSVSFKLLASSYTCGFPSPSSPKFQNIKISKIKRN
jgi:hypothetical protein